MNRFFKLRFSPSLCAGVVFINLVSLPAIAVEQVLEERQKEKTVVVTGSRIRHIQTEGNSPVLVLTRDDINRSGFTSIADILQKLPAAGSALNSRYNSSGNFGMPSDGGGVGAGSAEIGLRHLSSKRTLVLVNGKRWVNNSSASGLGRAVDLNTIPISVIEQIEILEDGASSIYGSDAIAGVVNIITRKDFDGLEATYYIGQFNEGDGTSYEFEMAYGSSSDKHNFFFGLSHRDLGEVRALDRSLASTAKPGGLGFHGSSATPEGRYLFTDSSGNLVNVTIDQNVSNPSFDPSNPGGNLDDFHEWTDADRYNYAAYNLYITPTKTTNIFTQGSYVITSDTNLNFTAMYNRRDSKNQAAPEPISIGPEAGTGNVYADSATIDVSNPYNPFGITLDESNFIFAGRRPIENGPREYFQSVDTLHISAGFDGVIEPFGSSFYWDINWGWSQNQGSQLKTGALNARRINLALGPIDRCNADPLCVPLDIFGTNSITQDMLNYISFVQHDNSEISLRTFSANITGDLFEMHAGPLGVALGVERRNESGHFTPDPIAANGETMGIPASPTSGSVEVNEYYMEANIPLLMGKKFAKELSISLAVRNSSYDTSGNELTNKIGVLWRPIDDLLIRGTVAEGFRAPSIAELYATGSRSDISLTDPCNSNDVNIQNTCSAIWNNMIYPDFNAVNASQISVNTGGNINLKAEISDSTTFGIVYDASWVNDFDWVDRFGFQLNFYNHDIKNAIQVINPQMQLNNCVLNNDSSACEGIFRVGSGTINIFDNALVNIGQIKTSGYDFSFNYTMSETKYGTFSAIWRNTIVNEYRENEGVNLVGTEFGSVPDRGLPKWKYDLVFNWKKENYSANWNIHWVSELTEACSDFLDDTVNSFTNQGLCSQPDSLVNGNSMNVLDDTFTHDLQLAYKTSLIGKETTLSLGMQNVFNQAPPACTSCDLNGYDPGVYQPQGRFIYIRGLISL